MDKEAIYKFKFVNFLKNLFAFFTFESFDVFCFFFIFRFRSSNLQLECSVVRWIRERFTKSNFSIFWKIYLTFFTFESFNVFVFFFLFFAFDHRTYNPTASKMRWIRKRFTNSNLSIFSKIYLTFFKFENFDVFVFFFIFCFRSSNLQLECLRSEMDKEAMYKFKFVNFLKNLFDFL